MDQVTQQNAALVEESAAAAEAMKGQAAGLQQAVSVFKLGDTQTNAITSEPGVARLADTPVSGAAANEGLRAA